MAYLSTHQLEKMGFKSLGKNVKISDKASIYDTEQIEIGDNSRVDDFCVLSGKLSIGRFVHITPFVLLAGGEKGITIKDFVGIAYAVQILTQSDDYSGRTLTSSLVPDQYKVEKKEAITIGKHAIIGANSVIFPGCSIAEGCAIGAMTLVTKSTDPWGIYTGIPARRISERKQDMLEFGKEFLESVST